jgi:uncharacterized membrane protein YccC
VYTQATTAYIVGQAAFSLFVIVAFSLANWPPDLGVAVERFEDIAYGAAISVVVALLMWPRGVLEGLRSNVAEAISRANAVLIGAVTDLVDGGHRVTSRELLESSAAFSRSEEVVEVSLASKSADATARANAWQIVIDNMRTLTVGGHLIAGWSSDRPPVESLVPALGPALIADARTTTSAWSRTAAMVEGTDPGPLPAQTALLDTARSVAAGADLADPAVSDRVVGAVWTHGWIHMAFNAAVSSQVPQLRK